MIVSMNKNPEKYTELFIKAHKFLGAGNDINSLAEYYGHMADFFATTEGYKYVMLPLDEDPFVIDLNSRNINVPASFSKCASVQNDQLAELIVFTADRYFDYMDLANTNIYVQWTIPADPKNNRMEAIEGATGVEMIDLDSEPSKIKFAWPLSKEITQHAGTVKFSVRFFRLDENDKVIYSLNTLESSIVIKPALQPELTDRAIVEEPISDSLFVGVIINSQHATEGVDLPLQPTYADPGSNIVILKKNDNDEWIVEAPYVATTVAGNPKVANLQNNTLTLGVQAVTADNGNLAYDWYYRSNVYNLVNINDAYKDNYHYFKKVNDTYQPLYVTEKNFNSFKADINEGIVYYLSVTKLTDKGNADTQKYAYVKCSPTEKNVRNDYFTYVSGQGETAVYDLVDQSIDFPAANTEYFERYSIYTIPVGTADVTGRYYADAWNIIPAGDKILITPTPTRSDDCLLPGPEDIVFEKDGNLATSAIIDSNEGVVLNVDVKDDAYGAPRTYQWESKVTEDGAFVTIQDEDAEAIAVTTPGWYRVQISSTFNREPKSNTSNICKVTNFPAPPVLKVQDETTVNLNTSNATFKVELNVGAADQADKLKTEGYKGIWQIKPGDAKEFTTLQDGYTGVTFGTTAFENDTITVTKDLKFNSASFRCLVTNTLNGEVAVFDHLGVGQVDTSIGTFELKTPYIFDPAGTDSFYFSTVKI